MDNKQKTSSDSLSLLHRDINSMGFASYSQAKKTKLKKKTKQENDESLLLSQNKLPPISGDHLQQQKNHRNSHKIKNSLIMKIQQFSNRISDLEFEKSMRRRKNQKLMDELLELREKHKSGHQSRINQMENPYYHRYQNPYLPPPQYPQFSQFPQYPPFMPIYQPKMPYQNQYMSIPQYPMASPNQITPMNQPQPQIQPQPQPFSHQRSQQIHSNQSHLAKRKLKRKLIGNRFRIAGYVVIFSLIFKKYVKSFTLNRFDHFQQNWGNEQNVKEAYNSLRSFFEKNISLAIFNKPQVKNLRQLQSIEPDKQGKGKGKGKGKPKKKAVSKNKKNKKSSSSSDESSSESSSESESSSSSQSSQSSKSSQSDKANKEQTFQYFVKIDVAVNFITDFIKEVTRVILQNQFEINHPFLTMFLPRQFQGDGLHYGSDLKYLNFHQQKGYSQHNQVVSEYLIIKNIFLDLFVRRELLTEICQKFHFKKADKIKEQPKGRFYFSFFIRNVVFKKIIENYLAKKVKAIQVFDLPKDELVPFAKQNELDINIKNSSFEIHRNGSQVNEENIDEISKAELKKKQRDFKVLLDDCCEKILKKLLEMRKNEYQKIHNMTSLQKFRNEANDYFNLHDRNKIKERNKRQNRKQLEFSRKNSMSDNLIGDQSMTSLLGKMGKIKNKGKNKK